MLLATIEEVFMSRTCLKTLAAGAASVTMALASAGQAAAQTVPSHNGVRGIPLDNGAACGLQYYGFYRSGPLLAKAGPGQHGRYRLVIQRRGAGNDVLADLEGRFDSRGRAEAVLAESQLQRHFLAMHRGPALGGGQIDTRRIVARLDVIDMRGRLTCSTDQVDAISIGAMAPTYGGRGPSPAPVPNAGPAGFRPAPADRF
jgi:hypothetical protein